MKHDRHKIILCDKNIIRVKTIAIASDPQYPVDKFWEEE